MLCLLPLLWYSKHPFFHFLSFIVWLLTNISCYRSDSKQYYHCTAYQHSVFLLFLRFFIYIHLFYLLWSTISITDGAAQKISVPIASAVMIVPPFRIPTTLLRCFPLFWSQYSRARTTKSQHGNNIFQIKKTGQRFDTKVPIGAFFCIGETTIMKPWNYMKKPKKAPVVLFCHRGFIIYFCFPHLEQYWKSFTTTSFQ